MKALLASLLLLIAPLQAALIPDVRLSVGFRERVEGVLQKPVYVLDVSCEDGECAFTYVSLNDCRLTASGSRAFYPKVESGSTRQGILKVTHEAGVLTLEQVGVDSIGDWVNTFRIGYAPVVNGAVATRVVSFTGGFIKKSELVRGTTAVEYVPLQDPFQEITPECRIVVPGVNAR